MRIGIDARFIGPEGTGLGVYTQNLIENLQKIDKRNRYFIFLKKNNWDYIKLQSKDFQKVLADVSWYTVEEQIKMPAIYRSQNLDLLHIPHFNVPILYNGKFIVTIHDLIHHHFPQTTTTTQNLLLFRLKRIGYHKIFKNAITRSKKIITPSNFVKEDLITAFKLNPSKIAVTYEAAEEEYFQKISNFKFKISNYLLYVGNTYPHKNITKLLDAMLILNFKFKISNLKLIIVCPRDVFAQRLSKEIRSRDLEKQVILKGYLQSPELKKLFQKASAYISPSLAEGFGISGLNAMASNTPVICSDIPTFREIYGEAVVYFSPKDPKDIAEKIKKVLKDPKTRSDLVKNGKEQVNKYSWFNMAKETLKVYNSI